MTFPLDKRRTLSMVERILKLGWCMDKTTVRCRDSAIDFRVCRTLKADPLSSPEVGSSRRRIPGSCRRLSPMETLLLSPPDSPFDAHQVFDRCPSRSSPRRPETTAEICFREVVGRRRRAVKVNVSETVRKGR
uniref:Uncharacterized protein n=1 Tax=Opuntia streptacantha TaxID=393608 RepID=A0A7C9D1X7_OPUST